MSLSPGTLLGPYEIQNALGAGGMGEVYRARDTRLDRSVAIKVLAPEIAGDPVARSRFEREARAVAALDHPHICGIFDVGEANGAHYLVMPHLDGQTLAARLEKGPLPLDQALTMATQVADALDKAHRQGIVHRDLKPANIMLTKTGAKLLDFGLAKLRAPGGPIALSGIERMATTSPGTAQGTILGTVQYMAPEQVEGREAGARADIWALGAVIYEMVTGTRPFQGESPASLIGAILKDTPEPLSARQPLAPRSLDDLIAGCFTKDPDDRWQSAADVKRQLANLVRHAGEADRARAKDHRRPAWVAWAIAALAVSAALAAWQWGPIHTAASPTAPVVRFQLTLPAGLTLVPEQPPAVSPDGLRLALVALDCESNRRQVYLRSLNTVVTRALAGTSDAQYPFWSHDGRRLAFFARGRLAVIDIESGGVQDLAPVPNPGGPGIWAGDAIVFAPNTGPVTRVPATGGAATIAAQFDVARESNQSIVGALADGRLLVSSQAGLFVASEGGSRILTSEITMPAALFRATRADGTPADVIVFIRNGRLMAQALDDAATTLEGSPVELAPEASQLVAPAARPFSAGGDVLAFVARSGIETRPTWVDRRGRVLGPAASVTGQMRDVRLSPDASRLSVSRLAAGSSFDLLLVDLRRDTVTNPTPGQSVSEAYWNRDGQSLIGVLREGPASRAIVRIPAAEGGTPEPLLRSTDTMIPAAPQVSPDGQHLAYTRIHESGEFDIYLRPLSGTGEGSPLLADRSYDAGTRISPDGRWFAYHSNESGELNVFIRSFPDGTVKQQVSVDGGQRPAWRSDGRELYYLAPDSGLWAASVSTSPTLAIGAPQRLFTAPVDPTFGTPGAQLFDPEPGGQRFVMLVPTADVPQPVTVILNWGSLLFPK